MDELADVRSLAVPLNEVADLDTLLDRVGDAHLVLLGEASHGTHEYYAWRAELTKRLIEEKGFDFVAVEGDWPDCHRVHESVVLADGTHDDPAAALAAFERWPTWMWANTDVVAFVRWLRSVNTGRRAEERVGFHGLDVYSLWDSMGWLLGYLREHEPELVEPALDAVRCFAPYGEDPQRYAYATLVPPSCQDAVIALLRRVCEERLGGDGAERFIAEQNAAVIAGAEQYYRAMVRGGPASWNIRDTHMADTLDRLLGRYTEVAGRPARGVVWEHNTHVGDARATDMEEAGMVNVGQLARERHGDEGVVIVGFAGHRGTVMAASSWGARPSRMDLPAARDGSVESFVHAAIGDDPALMVWPQSFDQPRWLRISLDHRAVGVVFRPERERWANYVPSTMGDRYDALLWFGETRALDPIVAEHVGDREPETFPSGM